MPRFWCRRKDASGKWWSHYLCTEQEMSELSKRYSMRVSDEERLWALSVTDARRVYYDDSVGEDRLRETMRHEWGHVEAWALKIEGHERQNARLHRAIDLMATGADWWPKRRPPRQ